MTLSAEGKEARNEYMREYRKNMTEEQKENELKRVREYKKNNIEKIRAYQATYWNKKAEQMKSDTKTM